MAILSVVIARKGSKGLENKVLREINGKRVFEYVVEYSLSLPEEVGEDVDTVVSSDSEIIGEYCRDRGICFFPRDPELAADTARVEDVLFSVMTQMNKEYEYVSLLYGNIPTRYPGEFVRACRFLRDHREYDAVLSMQNVEKYNPAWMFEFQEELLPEKTLEGYRRQDLTQYMIHDGHTILLRSAYFLEFRKSGKKAERMYEPFGRKIKPMLANNYIVDVDTWRDLVLAEAVLRSRLAGEGSG